MTTPFDYPVAPHVRRHGPRGYAGYESYRPWLRDEFAFRCVYCLTREVWTRAYGAYAIDHFLPVATDPALETEYGNLLYACIPCNLAKSSDHIPDPLGVLLHESVVVSDDGTIRGTTPEASRLIELVGLDRPRAVEFREMWVGIVRLAATFDTDRHRRIMGYPADLPDLSALDPPGGNAKPEGVAASHLARRKAGTLPDTY